MTQNQPPVHTQALMLSPLFSALQCFDPNETSFSTWIQLFEEFCTANNVLPEPDPTEAAPVPPHNRRRALFLSYVGPRAYEVLRTACLPVLPNQNSIPSLIEILRERYEPAGLRRANRLLFSKRNQKENESVSEFISALQDLASKCDFGLFHEDAITDRIIAGIRHNDTRQKLIAIPNLTYLNAKQVALQDEAVRSESRALAQSVVSSDVHRCDTSRSTKFRNSSVHSSKKNFKNQCEPKIQFKQPSGPSAPRNQKPIQKWNACHRCGGKHDVRTCPAIKWECFYCKKIGHTAKVCKSKLSANNNKRVSTYHITDKAAQPSDKEEDATVDKLLHLSVFKIETQSSSIITPVVPDYCNKIIQMEKCIVPESIEGLPAASSVQEFEYNSSLCSSNVNICDSSVISISPSANTNLSGEPKYLTPHVTCNSYSSQFNQSYPYPKLINLVNTTDKLTSPPLYIEVNVDNTPIEMEIDSGAGASVISASLFKKLLPNKTISKSRLTLNSVAGEIPVEGEAKVTVKLDNKIFSLPIFICTSAINVVPLMGRTWIDHLFPDWRKTFSSGAVNSTSVHKVEPPTIEKLKEFFPRVFDTKADSVIEGFTARLVLKPEATPIFHKAYTLPFGLIQKVNNHLEKLEQDGKIVKLSQSEWASPGVVVQKKEGDIRFCVDFKKTLNPQLRVDQYPLPRPDDVFANLSSGTIFCSLDLTDAYTQLALHPDSQDLCVVNTHRGLFKYTRLIYGIASAAAIFQSVMDNILKGIKGVVCYIDNILIQGQNLTECTDRTMTVLSRLEKFNVRLKLSKCVWFAEEIEYLGFVISKNGRRPAPNLTSAILQCKTPSSVKEVRSFLGMISFYSQFLPQFSTVTGPLRKLTEKNTTFKWSPECNKAFDSCKQLLTSSNLLVHFDPALPIVVYADASPIGVGAALCHSFQTKNKIFDQPIMYASSSLNSTQQNYAQIDREALAVIFAVSKFHRFLWGRHFTLVTDNIAIQRILNPNKSLPVRTGHRLQHWAAILQAYNYNLIHKKSEYLCTADALSRLPSSSIIEEVFHVEIPPNLPLTAEIIAVKTSEDPLLSKVFHYCHIGWPVKDAFKNNPELQRYFKLRDTLTIVDKCLLFSARVIIPSSLQAPVLKLLHEGHPGVVRSKLLARSVVWWPSLNQDLESYCNNCTKCSSVNFRPQKDYVPWPQATSPFERIHIDFFEIKSVKFFILCDAFSKWMHIIQLFQTTAEDVQRELLFTFSIWGLPKIIVSDNGPPFESIAYAQFCTKYNIQIVRSPPYSPESNGLAERAVQIAKKGLQKIFDNPPAPTKGLSSHIPCEFHQTLSLFLFNYRNTPTTTTMKSPNETLLNYRPRTLLTHLLPNKTKTPSTHLYRDGESVFVRLDKKTPVLPGTIVKMLGPTRYIVSINGVLKHVHVNQIARTSKV